MSHAPSTAYPATRRSSLRLLPWSSPDGKPCFLDTDDDGGVMSRLADNIEAAQTGTGTEVLATAKSVLADPHADSPELRLALAWAVDSLGDVLRVAESRGARLLVLVPDELDDQDEDRTSPAESFG